MLVRFFNIKRKSPFYSLLCFFKINKKFFSPSLFLITFQSRFVQKSSEKKSPVILQMRDPAF
ncbi:hypothetical protein RhiirA5_368199 [Rhizophagus irregularis]|uniref:Uncharacterized protein n=1 Tax=Rhizophagus irregularis TaxID=588596 RepID=A0A2N0NFZ4_9GLOM|nr:hypothetical protein RhiirA5_368365 [Rhizophagus irregularis]PKB94496.1 hypothetical protein RhiirA5_368199 [Rhizophagus irregularis]GET53155.1 hypothetical protein RIR_e73535_A0A2N0NFZ4_9GLOM [Rhizophagus irregularis DAOM 181602=DAOM 197198]GET54745.1 hypothetical protein RIR_e73536_A0A2N0NFZ4_9GLOM [Rhizophagus irregularis DAOM 181602=DAOM 197198]GET66080.1 hypothetical protein RIR_e73537_A0A2N0NFZ4_9GLOM [Rhizophagus irregularis DAOM 181602=DAOM 197198]